MLTASWTAPTTNVDGSPLIDLASYRVYYGLTNQPCPGPIFLSVPSSTTTPPSNQTVTATLTGLTTGTPYFAAITAIDSGGNESACSVVATAVARIDVDVSPTGTVDFGTVNVGTFADRILSVQNTGGGIISGTVSTSPPFSIVSGGTFTLAGVGSVQAVTVRFTPTAVALATANLTFSANGNSVSRSVTGAGAGDTTPPTVQINSPTTASSFNTSSTSLTLAGTASDSSAVTQVMWANDRGGNGVATGTSSWTASGIGLQPGTNVLTVTAQDAVGNIGTAALTVTLTDAVAPTVSLSAPVAGVSVSGTIVVGATATDNVGVVGVQFKLDGAALGTEATTPPYAVPWNTVNVANGSHTLTAVARDAAGNTATSAAVTVMVSNVSSPPVPPSLTLAYNGKLRDRVGQGSVALSADGAPDGTLTATLSASGGRTVTGLTLQSSAPGTWDTDGLSAYWVLGAAPSLDGALLNNSATMGVNFPVPDGGSFIVFAADSGGIEFLPGTTLTLTATFADGSSATGTTTVAAAATTVTTASGGGATLTLTYNGTLRDRVGQGNLGVAADGALDGTLTAMLTASGGRTVTRLTLQSSAPGTWDTDSATGYWVLGVASTLDGNLLNDSSTMAVNFSVPDGGGFVVFAADYAGTEFVSGTSLTLQATFADGSVATAQTTVP